MIKNIAGQIVSFRMLSTTDGSDITSGSPTVYVTGDGGTQVSGSGTITHEGNGEWSYAPTQAETNYNHIAFSMVLSGAFSQTVNVYTTYPQTGDAYAVVTGLNDISADDVNSACDTALSDYGANTTTPPTVAEIRAEMDSNSTQLSAILTDTGTTLPALLTTIDSVVDAIQVVTNLLPDAGALSSLAQSTALATVDTNIDTLITRLTAARAGYLDALNVTGTLAHSDAAAIYQADVSSLATSADISDLQVHGDANWGSSGENPNVLLASEITSVTSQTVFVLTSGSDQDDAYNNQSIVFYDDSNSDYPSVRVVSAYIGSTKTITVDSAPDFTVGSDDSIRVFVTAPGSTAPTAAQVADAVWDEAIADHTTSTTFGAKNQHLVPSETIEDYQSSSSGGDATAENQTTIIGHLTDIKGSTFATATDSLEAIRDRGDVAWLTGAGGSAPTVAEIRAEIDSNSTQLATIVADTNELQTNQSNWLTADISGLAASIASILADTNELQTNQDNWLTADLSTITANISTLLTRLSSTRAGYLDKLNVPGTLANSDAANTYKADISSLASNLATILTATGTTIPGLINNLNDPTASVIADAVLAKVLPDVSGGKLDAGQSITLALAIRAVFNRFYREVVQTSTTQTVKNDSGTSVAAMTCSEVSGISQTKGAA